MLSETGEQTPATDAAAGPAVRIEIEHPLPGEVVFPGDSLMGFGWVLAGSPVRGIAVALDDEPLGQAVTGLARTDIAEEYGDHPGAARAGFTFNVKIPGFAAPQPELRLTVRTDAGQSAHVVPLTFQGPDRPAVAPPAAPKPARPAVQLDLDPIRITPEEARLDAGGLLMVRGWAVTAQATQSVEILAGGVSLGFADARLSRDDVAAAFPQYPDSRESGFMLKCQIPPGLEAGTDVHVVVTDATGLAATAVIAMTGAGVEAAAKPALPALQATLEEARVNELGVLRVRGWAVGLSAIEQVRVYLDETLVGLAAHHQPREDVAVAFPDYPDAALAGFLLQQETPEGSLEGVTVRVNVAALGGIRRDLVAPLQVAPVIRRRERVANSIEFHCDGISLSEDGALQIEGWAVCASGVEAIEVDLGEDALGQAQLGGERPDVGNHFPQFAGARNAGFSFAGQVAHRCEGEYVVRITVRGRGGETKVIPHPVLAQGGGAAAYTPAAGSEDRGIRYYMDTPVVRDGRATDVVRGFLSVNGWAFSAAGVNSIELFAGERSLGQAYRGIRREDLHTTFGRKEALRSGFAMLVPPQQLKRGVHGMRLVISDAAGQREVIAFTLEAEPELEGPGPWSLRRKLTQAEVSLQMSVLAAAGYAPYYTLLLPLGGTAAAQTKKLRATFESLRYQAYENWQVLIPATGEDAAAVAALAGEFPGLAGHIHTAAIGSDAPLASLVPDSGAPALLCLLTPGDQLGEDALLELSVAAAVAQERPGLLYSDERRIDPADGKMRAYFKPDWSPDLMLSSNYIGRLWAARADVLAATGATFEDIAKHGEYDLALRLTEQTAAVAHVPKVLAARGARTLDSAATERRALARALQRRGIEGEVQAGCIAGTYRVHRSVQRPGLVSIIIPSIASRGLIETAIASIRAHTRAGQCEILILDNIRDAAPEENARWKAWFREHADRVIEVNEKFNWSRLNNIGAQAAQGEYLLFLNDDIEVLDSHWLDGMLEHAQRPEVGVTGPRLLYPNGTVQHAGMFLSGGVGRHLFRFQPADEPGPFGLARTQRDVMTVTGACMMVRRDVFDEIGGFNEEHSVINNDLDFCLRARRSGRTVIYTPHVTLTHHEMVSRGELRDVFNEAAFAAEWQDQFQAGDPYFNPNLAADVDDYVAEQEPFRLVYSGHPVVSRSKVRRIVAIKVDHIGDFIAAFPAFRRIKAKFPNAELTVVCAAASISLASLEPAIDRVVRFDFYHSQSERGRRALAKKELQALEEELAPLQFDLAIDLRRQPDTRHILQSTGARWLAGFDVENRTEWLDIAVEWEGDVARTHKRTHISDALVQFIDAVSVSCEDDQQVIHSPITIDEARATLAALPAVAAIAPDLFARKLVCLHLGAGAENKRWPVASFAGLADLLAGRENLNVVVTGGPDETALADELAAKMRHKDRLFPMVGKLGLRQLPLLLRSCVLYVGNDSGPKHIASALGVPTVGVHSGSVDAVEWGPMGHAAFGVRRAMTCSPCYLAKAADCPRSLACIHGIRVADVFRACQGLLTLSRPLRQAEFPAGNISAS